MSDDEAVTGGGGPDSESGCEKGEVSDDELHRQLLEILDKTTLDGVSMVQEEASVEPLGADVDRIELTFRPADYRVAGEGKSFQARYSIEAEYIDIDDETYARISVTHIVSFSCSETFDYSHYHEKALSVWLEMNVFFIAYPYMRSAVHAAAARLEVPPLTLGVLPRDAGRPRRMITVPRYGDHVGELPDREA